jgi:hypothetical protein
MLQTVETLIAVMMNRLIFSRVIGGELSASAEMEFRAAVAQHEDREVAIKVARKKKKRSLSQNAFMHGPFFESLQAMFEEFGNEYDSDMVKAIFKKQFGIKKLVELPDKSQELVEISTADYDPAQCEDCMEKARRRYAEYWQLPYPNENMEPRYV